MSRNIVRWMSEFSVSASSGRRSQGHLEKGSRPSGRRSPCVLCLDGSGSMEGEPIRELNAGLKQFFDEVRATPSLKGHLDLAILRFAGDVQVVRPMGPLCEETAPVIAAGGETNLGEALGRSLGLIERSGRHAASDGEGRPMPWLIVMTDGCPTDRWEEQAWRVRSLAFSSGSKAGEKPALPPPSAWLLPDPE